MLFEMLYKLNLQVAVFFTFVFLISIKKKNGELYFNELSF